MPGALEFLLEAMEHFEIAIFSSRSRYIGGRWAMKRWLRRWLEYHLWEECGRGRLPGFYGFTAADLGEDLGRQNFPAVVAARAVARIAFPLWKPAAHLAIDDRALTFTGTWPAIDTLKEFKPWNKR